MCAVVNHGLQSCLHRVRLIDYHVVFCYQDQGFANSLQLQIDGEVVLDGWHDTAYEFEEDEEALSDLRLATVGLYGFDNRLHDLRVVARMDACLFHVDVRMLLHGHCLLRVVGGDVLKYLSLTQRVAFLVVAGEPQPWRLSVEIVCYA